MEVVVASRNARKLAEMQALLAPLNWRLRSVGDFTTKTVEENAPTFVGNALLKARQAAQVSGLPAIADDSGIEVDALQGAPGVRSARFAGEAATDEDNNRKLLQLLRDVRDERRNAQFVCVLVFLRQPDDPEPLIAQGRWAGRILRSPRGANGFGYDPLFLVPDRACSSAELDPAEKNRISHRGQAIRALLAQLREA